MVARHVLRVGCGERRVRVGAGAAQQPGGGCGVGAAERGARAAGERRLDRFGPGQWALGGAATASLAALDGLLTVQLAIGLPAETATITLADSLVPPSDSAPDPAGELLRVAAAVATLRSEDRNLALAHRSVLPAPSLQVGVERGDPAEPAQGVLPTVGLALALPLFNRNGGEIGQARAARDRAQANLDVTRRESAADVARARRSFAAALARLERDRRLLASADRVAAMSLQAYAEGAIPLANVLEAQRNAREALGRYIDDIAAANDAAGVVRLVTASSGEP